ncbi:MAG: MaoC-like dehydratase [Promethearchaeota archaeon CR_4]|nr:MAG: MaoC-like dehydratase [Candidatus Lokiarchaeota archaeon CR_4]
MAILKVNKPMELKPYVGKEIGTTDWIPVPQSQINMFADATDDHQWIHVDVERAKRESPFKGPIAHGYWTLSQMPNIVGKVVDVTGVKMAVNYGLNKVRFPNPVHVGKRIRGKVVLSELKELGQGNVEAQFTVTVEVEGVEKPACIAETLSRFYV